MQKKKKKKKQKDNNKCDRIGNNNIKRQPDNQTIHPRLNSDLNL